MSRTTPRPYLLIVRGNNLPPRRCQTLNGAIERARYMAYYWRVRVEIWHGYPPQPTDIFGGRYHHSGGQYGPTPPVLLLIVKPNPKYKPTWR